MHYTITPYRPSAHLFKVSCEIPHPDPQGQVVSLPAWIPGSYMIRDFARNVIELKASAAGQPLAVTKLDKSTWALAPTSETVVIEMEVYAWDLSVRSAHLDSSHGYFNGTSVFLRVHGREQAPCSVDILPPPQQEQWGWRVATSMKRDTAALWEFGRYQADNYDDLIDHPVEMADFALATFEAGGIPHDIVISGRHRADMDRLCRDLKPICETHVGMFGELPPMERYLFMVLVVGEGYGGLEHRASCSLICSRADLPLAGQADIDDKYRTFLGLCSHEYFHTWNVKRIKPEGFMPYDLTNESYTRQLWAFEGITSYYDDLGLVRSGVINDDAYLELLGQTATRVWRTPGRFKQSVADSSFDAWTKFYRQDENAPNAIVSYYTKGSLIALALDVLIRRLSGGARSLDDLMRRLWLEYGKPGIGVPEGRIEEMATEMAGEDLGPFFADVLYGTGDPDLKELLAWFGVEFMARSRDSLQDQGGKPATKPAAPVKPTLGIVVKTVEGQAVIASVINDGAAEQAGLAAGDVLLALDGLKLTPGNLEALVASYPVGDELELFAFRRDELNRFTVRLQAPEEDTVVLLMAADVDQATQDRRRAWLVHTP